jgi:hypothetical protein
MPPIRSVAKARLTMRRNRGGAMSSERTTVRREFLGRMAAGSAGLLVAGAGVACAAPPEQAATTMSLPADGEWLSKLHGTHRQYFDVTSWNDGFGMAYALNWSGSMKSTYGLDDNAVCPVIGLRHFAIAPAFGDAIWEKYKLGKFFSINDPKTKQPSVRNFAYNETEGDFMLAGTSLGRQIPTGAVVTVCNLATTVISGLAAGAAGLSLTPEQAYDEWKAALQPGCYLVPTGVLAVHRAQVAGECTYCYAG